MNRKLHIFLPLLLCSLLGYGQNLEIWEIQGTGNFSPFSNQTITTEDNIVTAASNNPFNNLICVQTPDDRADADAATSNGLLVNLPPGLIVPVGNRITLTGRVVEINGMTQMQSSNLVLTVLNDTNTILPSTVELNESFPSQIPTNIPEFESVEGMLVDLPQAITTASTRSDGTTSIVAGTTRSFREPGIPAPGITGLPVWDNNPERFELRPTALGEPAVAQIPGGTPVSATGIIYDDGNMYELWPTAYEVDFLPPPSPVREKSENEVTVASYNMLGFFSDEPEYEDRLQKIALFITQQLQAPDIIAVQEVENLTVLNDLIGVIQNIDPTLDYTAYLNLTNTGSFPINLGYLVLSTVSDVSITPLGTDEDLSNGGRLHDRPPLLLEGNFTSVPPTPIQVLNLHNRSLGGITGSNASAVRTKRHEQAISVAYMVRSLQYENLIVLGDFNAFQFSDGYVDVYNQIAGTPSLGAQFETEPILVDPLHTFIDLLPPNERYSFVFGGNAQILDHVLTSELEGLSVSGFAYARGNADYPTFHFTDLNNALRTSDHDAPILYLELDNIVKTTTIPFAAKPVLSFANPLTLNDPIIINLPIGGNQKILLYQMDGTLIAEKDLGFIERGESILENPFSLATENGIFVLRLQGDHTDVSKVVWLDR